MIVGVVLHALVIIVFEKFISVVAILSEAARSDSQAAVFICKRRVELGVLLVPFPNSILDLDGDFVLIRRLDEVMPILKTVSHSQSVWLPVEFIETVVL